MSEELKIDFEFACCDDCLDHMVPSDLRRLVSERDQLRAELSHLKAGQGEAAAWARQCDLDESDPAIFVARERVEESGYVMPLYLAPPTPAATQVELLNWAIGKWYAEVSQRPLINVHRRSLDDTWRQIIRKLDGNPADLCGPDHDSLVAQEVEL